MTAVVAMVRAARIFVVCMVMFLGIVSSEPYCWRSVILFMQTDAYYACPSGLHILDAKVGGTVLILTV